MFKNSINDISEMYSAEGHSPFSIRGAEDGKDITVSLAGEFSPNSKISYHDQFKVHARK